MKKLIFSAALAIFAVTALAQTKTSSKSDVSVAAKGTTENKGKGAEVSATAKTRSEVELRRNEDRKMSPEEKAARKEAKKERNASRKPERTDDDLKDGTASESNAHGKAVSEVATSTTLEGREKGALISGVAKANSNGEFKSGDKARNSDLSPEEKAARKEKNKARKADRADDGLLNGSAEGTIRGKGAGDVEVGTGARVKTKGGSINTGGRTKAKVGTGAGISVGKGTRIGL